tara:strand:- start:109 stop:804 length:696 start_codon:yes stop_codon:yes gene_type:complete
MSANGENGEYTNSTLMRAFHLASLLNLLFEATEPVSHQLRSWISTTFSTNISRSRIRTNALSERARSAILELADVWQDKLSSKEPSSPPLPLLPLPPLPPPPPPPAPTVRERILSNHDAQWYTDCRSPESVLKPILEESEPGKWSDLVSVETWKVNRGQLTNGFSKATQQLALPESREKRINRIDQEKLWRVAFLGVDDRFGTDNRFISPERVWLSGPSPKELRMDLEGWA